MKATTKAILTAAKLLKDIARNPYAFPGGYVKMYVCDGATICGHCVKARFDVELYDLANGYYRDHCVTLWQDGDNYCEHCNRQFSEI